MQLFSTRSWFTILSPFAVYTREKLIFLVKLQWRAKNRKNTKRETVYLFLVLGREINEDVAMTILGRSVGFGIIRPPAGPWLLPELHHSFSSPFSPCPPSYSLEPPWRFNARFYHRSYLPNNTSKWKMSSSTSPHSLNSSFFALFDSKQLRAFSTQVFLESFSIHLQQRKCNGLVR